MARQASVLSWKATDDFSGEARRQVPNVPQRTGKLYLGGRATCRTDAHVLLREETGLESCHGHVSCVCGALAVHHSQNRT